MALRQTVPFLRVLDMERALAFWRDGLGFEVAISWTPQGSIRWCRIERDGLALMLQDYRHDDGISHPPAGERGLGVSIVIFCDDALAIYHEALGRGLQPDRPFVGNGLWVTGFTDPDGYRVEFESETDQPEETEYQG
ncbi:catechol 2,3-dioxygenase-like lactoylglutathione lyase family enzyme [Caulobacter ginsengisoli]|uniref:Catechol 2,3-dioxygenase-like lactoylglutathione lyase family enzyme n=1 Tax=Caulobacter ginsengisoli TaxID=400775 RepID=A0ABU0IX87_9CAUL|nr:VOC family protein [Caulobacter ginsengisoli]MDQ0466612.1 catechol 2,3-dioxygenase-like lactoylglutathione lyase family enzyme [Caulobacter ginsengisoli]